MPRLEAWQGSVAPGALASTAKIELLNGLQLQLQHSAIVEEGGSVQTTLVGKDWEVAYTSSGQELCGQKTWPVAAGKLTISQAVPGLKWAILPSPTLELETHPYSLGKLQGASVLSLCTMDGCLKLQQKLELGRHVLDFTASRSKLTGGHNLSGGVHAIFPKGAKHRIASLGARHGGFVDGAGPSLHLNLTPAKRLSLSLAAEPLSRTLTASLDVLPEVEEGANLVFTTTVQQVSSGLPLISPSLSVSYAL